MVCLENTLSILNNIHTHTHTHTQHIHSFLQILRQLTAEGTQRSTTVARPAPTGTRTETGSILDLGTEGVNEEEGQQQVTETAPEEVQNEPNLSSLQPKLN